MSGLAMLARIGFDVPKLRYSLRTALAACAALLVAWLLGLEHPQWSAMTVWAASQPTRGQLLEKCLFRIAGTFSGAMVGIALMVLSGGKPVILVCGLAVWIALCAGIGNVQRGYVAYGTILAGYSAAMVALLDSDHPDHVLALGADRTATILVGVLLALIAGLLFTPRAAEEDLTGRLRRLTARVLRSLTEGLGAPSRGLAAAEQYDILADMAAIEESLEPHGAGSLRSRRTVHAVRSLLMAELSLLLVARRPRAPALAPDIVDTLQAEAAQLEGGASRLRSLSAPDRLVAATASEPALNGPLSAMAEAIRDYAGRTRNPRDIAAAAPAVALHRDWAGAWRAFVRAGIVMLAVGLLWAATGWSAGPFLLLGVSIMTSLFSTFDNPAGMMRDVFIGQVFGALGALACRFLVWPLAGSEWAVVLLTMPFILAGALFFAHRRTVPVAFDYAMVSLLLLHPSYPLAGDVAHMLSGAVAVVAAPLIAMAAYRFVFPIDVSRRIALLAGMMIREVQGMAQAGDASAHRRVWRARLYHRLLRLTRLADKGGGERAASIDGGLTILALGSAVLAIHDLLGRADLPAGVPRRLTAALARLERVAEDAPKAAATLSAAARTLSPFDSRAAETLLDGATALAANEDFLRRAA